MRRRSKKRMLTRFLADNRESVLYAVALIVGIIAFLGALHSCARQEEPAPPGGGVRVVAEP